MRLLAVLPHPDDESYSMGATLARCAEAGVSVHVLCLTRGEGGPDRVAGRTGEDLANARAAELRASCEILGAECTQWSFPDGLLPTVKDGPRALAEFVARLRPDAVVTLGADGAYGHVDHLAATSWVDGLDVPRTLHVAFPPGLFSKMHRYLRRRPFVVADPGPLGTPREDVDLVAPVGALRERKLASMAAHATQCGGQAQNLLPVDIEPLLVEEWFTIARGTPIPPGAVLPTDGLG